MATTFSYSDALGKKKTLALELNPYNVSWNYNVNTNIQDTYTGQVIQILSVNIDSLVIEGQLGVEGAFGKTIKRGKLVDRGFAEQFNPAGRYPGLHAMAEFFREYFAIMSQGADRQVAGQYRQTPMVLHYDVETSPSSRLWPKIIPIGFPSFRRAHDNFAPMWKIEAHVLEADPEIADAEKKSALKRLQQGIGYKIENPFSDPALNEQQIIEENQRLITGFRALLPSYSQAELRELVWNGVSVPRFVDKSRATTQATEDYLEGEQNYGAEKRGGR